ncbi:LAQU0S17e01860g1_1 [Lachancea quebecensis]|uniref:LAQU0S17e01860g1_1 n=1 Tax=Lachancea quebecensis TaxID=1654605 RepID=A0A0P1KWK0_9SACH|nr:LAQU0S17e01860g1_1 [Lachancea quebecensis]
MQRLRNIQLSHVYANVHLKQDWGLLTVIAICSVAYGLVPAVTSILTGTVFNLLQQPAAREFGSVNALMRELTSRSMAILATGIASIPLCWLSISAWMSLGERQAFRLRRKLLHSYLSKSMAWYDANEQISGDFTQLNRCVEELRASSAESSAIVFQNVVTVVALLGSALYYSWSLTLVILANSPLVIGFAVFFSRKVEKHAKRENAETSSAAGTMAWSLDAAKMIRLLGTQDRELMKFGACVQNCRKHFNKMSLFSSLNYSILRLLTLCMFVQGFWYGNSRINIGKLKPGDVVTCFSSCVLLASTLNSTLHQIIVLQKGSIGLQKVMAFVNSCDTNSAQETGFRLTSCLPLCWRRASITFQNVIFSYPTRPKDLVLKGVSLNFPAGETTFVIGKSGSGKSTIGNLLLRFYKNDAGAIKINEQDIRDIDQSDLARNIMLVEQTTSLFTETLANNVTIGESTAGNDEILLKQACQMAMLGNVIRDLAKGLETTIGYSGLDLSGGEQQRVALARAYFRNAPILILDEALSAQDRIHKSLLMEAIRKWRIGKTTIILTHELSDILDTDYVYVMGEGQIKECGSKSSLISNPRSEFSNLYRFQACDDDFGDVVTLGDGTSQFLDQKLEGIRTDKEEMYSELGSPSTLQTCSVPEPDYYPAPSHALRNSMDLLQSSIMTPHRTRRGPKTKGRVDATELELYPTVSDIEKGEVEPNILSLTDIIKRLFINSRQKRLLAVGGVSALLAGVANPLFSYTFSKLLSGIASNTAHPAAERRSTKWSLIVLSVALLDSIFTFMKCLTLSKCGENWIRDLRLRAFKSVSNRELSWFSSDQNSTSNVSSLIINDLRDLRALASEFLAAVTTLVVVSFCGLIWALASGWKLSLVCISLIPIFILFTGAYGGLLQRCEADYKSAVANMEDQLYNAVKRIKTIRCLQVEDRVIKEYKVFERQTKLAGKKRALGTGFGVALSNALTLVTQSILLYYGMKLVITGEYSSARMFQTLTLLLFTIMTCMSLIAQIPEISRGQRAATYLFRILDSEMKTIDVNIGQKSALVKRKCSDEALIFIKDLNFSYSLLNNPMVYQGLNLSINTGETVGLVGLSGSGKSTIWHLITRLYKVSNGSIWFDGLDVNDWEEGALRKRIAIVEQKPRLFRGTILDNLTYGLSKSVDEREIQELLALVGMLDFVNLSPQGLRSFIDTEVLSGGQLQRLAIVRALLRKPQLLVLDECTSALDAQHGFIMSEFVRQRSQATTTLVLTHSEQMMRACSRILTFSNGSIVEDGPFEQLYNRKGELFRILSSFSE